MKKREVDNEQVATRRANNFPDDGVRGWGFSLLHVLSATEIDIELITLVGLGLVGVVLAHISLLHQCSAGIVSLHSHVYEKRHGRLSQE